MLVEGRKPTGSVNAAPLVPLAIAPSRRMTPLSLMTAALRVANGALVQPFCSARPVKPAAVSANDAPSSEVKHCALENVLFSAWTNAAPLGEMLSRPLVALHRSTGT